MRKLLLVLTLFAALGVVASSAQAQQTKGVNLRWNDCVLAAGVADKTTGCASDAGNNFLVASFVPPAPGAPDTITTLTGEDAFVDLIAASAGLPDWWAYQSGGCRFGSMVNSAQFITLSTCSNPWSANVSGGSNYTPAPTGTSYTPLPNTARLECVFAVPPADAIHVTNDQEWYAFYSLIKNNHTITSPCAGCATPVCIVFNEIDLSMPGGIITALTTPTAAGLNMVTWAGGTGATCATVPVKRTTWGEVKSLYR
jgi:hypothetical protein